MKKIRIISLILTFAFLFTLAAGAAYPAGGYADQSQISSKTLSAIKTMGDLNIMYGSTKTVNGVTGTYFDPLGTLTRAEIARIIYTIDTGKDNADMWKTAVKSTFKDVSNSWALGFINYCYAQGYLSGKSATVFDPAGKLTLAEAMTVLLAFMGFKKEDLAAGWPNNVIIYASQKDLFDNGVEQNSQVMSALQRQWCAVVISNALDCKTVVKQAGGNYADTSTTVLERSYSGYTVKTGLIQANDRIATSGSAAAAGTFRMSDGTVIPYDVANNMVGREVEVKYMLKGSTVNVLSVNAVSGYTTVSTTAGAISFSADNTLNFTGHAIKYSDSEIAGMYFFTAEGRDSYATLAAAKAFLTGLPDCAKIEFVLKDGKIKTMHITPYTFTLVTNVSADGKITGTGLSATKAASTSGIVANDYIVYYVNEADGLVYATKVSPSTVTITYSSGSDLYVGTTKLVFVASNSTYNKVANGAPTSVPAAAAFAGNSVYLYSYGGSYFMIKLTTAPSSLSVEMAASEKTVRTYSAGRIVTALSGFVDGNYVTYESAESASAISGSVSPGDPVKVTLSAAGKLVSFTSSAAAEAVTGTVSGKTSAVNGIYSITVGGNTYIITSVTIVTGVNGDYDVKSGSSSVENGKKCTLFFTASGSTRIVDRMYIVQ